MFRKKTITVILTFYFILALQRFFFIYFKTILIQYNYDKPELMQSTHQAHGYKNDSYMYSTQLSTKFILLINVKMPTFVGILTFISMTNTTSEKLKARNFFIVGIQLKFRAHFS